MSKLDHQALGIEHGDLAEPADKHGFADDYCDRHTSITGFVAR
jgi:hypothetical protein